MPAPLHIQLIKSRAEWDRLKERVNKLAKTHRDTREAREDLQRQTARILELEVKINAKQRSAA